MYEGRKGVIMLKVNEYNLRARLKQICGRGAKWSVRCDKAGIGNNFMANGLSLYRTKEKEFEDIYGYIKVETYEAVCKEFKLDPAEFCEDWEDFIKKYRTPCKNEQTENPVADERVLEKLALLDAHIIEQTAVMKQIGNLLAQINDNMKPKPTFQKPLATLRK